MSKIIHWVRANCAVLAVVMFLALGAGLLGTVVSGPQMRKLDHFSKNHYRAVAWSPQGLQIQLAQHDPTTELNAWLSSLDIRNKTGHFMVDIVGLRAWKYDTDGLQVSIFQVPLWCILTLPIASFFYWRSKNFKEGHGPISVSPQQAFSVPDNHRSQTRLIGFQHRERFEVT